MGKFKAEKKASQDKALKLQREKLEALRASMTPEERAKADKRIKRFKLSLLIFGVSMVSLIAIGILSGSGSNETSSDSSATVSDNSGVDWKNYAPGVRTRIDALIQSKDCINLQKEFDIADQNDSAQRNRVGVGNADLMDYLNKEMQRLGCN